MTLRYTDKNILDSDLKTLVVPTSCKGNIGKNQLLLYVRKNFPESFKPFKKLCSKKKVFITEPIISRNVSSDKIENIIFLPIRHEEDENLFLANRLITSFNNLVKLCNKENINNISIDLKSLGNLSRSVDVLDKVLDMTIGEKIERCNIHTTELHASDINNNNEFIFY